MNASDRHKCVLLVRAVDSRRRLTTCCGRIQLKALLTLACNLLSHNPNNAQTHRNAQTKAIALLWCHFEAEGRGVLGVSGLDNPTLCHNQNFLWKFDRKHPVNAWLL